MKEDKDEKKIMPIKHENLLVTLEKEKIEILKPEERNSHR